VPRQRVPGPVWLVRLHTGVSAWHVRCHCRGHNTGKRAYTRVSSLPQRPDVTHTAQCPVSVHPAWRPPPPQCLCNMLKTGSFMAAGCATGTACRVDATISVLVGMHSCRIGCVIKASTRQSVAVSLLTTLRCLKAPVTANCNVVTTRTMQARAAVPCTKDWYPTFTWPAQRYTRPGAQQIERQACSGAPSSRQETALTPPSIDLNLTATMQWSVCQRTTRSTFLVRRPFRVPWHALVRWHQAALSTFNELRERTLPVLAPRQPL
jgi:hypothetical protein